MGHGGAGCQGPYPGEGLSAMNDDFYYPGPSRWGCLPVILISLLLWALIIGLAIWLIRR